MGIDYYTVARGLYKTTKEYWLYTSQHYHECRDGDCAEMAHDEAIQDLQSKNGLQIFNLCTHSDICEIALMELGITLPLEEQKCRRAKLGWRQVDDELAKILISKSVNHPATASQITGLP